MIKFINKSTSLKEDDSSVNVINIFDATTERIINRLTAKMIKNGCFPQHMEDDIALEMTIIISKEARKYNPQKSQFHTFVQTVLSRRAVNIIRDWKRKGEETVSINCEIDEDGNTVECVISDDDYQMFVGNRTRPVIESQELLDCEMYVISKMDTETQKICHSILEGASISELARKYGISRTGFRKKYIVPIRKEFIRHGLTGFCGKVQA